MLQPALTQFLSESAVLEHLATEPLKNIEGAERRLALVLEQTQEMVLDDLAALAWLHLSHRNGFVREKALLQLSGAAPHLFFLALALRRLNDWVPQVRAAACRVLPEVVRCAKPAWVAQVLSAALPHCHSWGRMGTQEQALLLSLARQAQVAQALYLHLQKTHAGPVAVVLAQLGRHAFWDSYLLGLAQEALQPAVRAKAYRSLLTGKMQWFEGRRWEWTDRRYCQQRWAAVIGERALTVQVDFEMTLHQAARDVAVCVRRLAADVLIAQGAFHMTKARLLALAQHLATDPAASVAERGAFALRKFTQTL